MNIISLGKDPVSPDQPAGSDIRYDPDYEELQAEIDKISIPSASGGINWKKVSDLAAAILEKKSKDLLVASYLAVSQIHTRHLDGLADGLTVLHDLINTYWEDLFPLKKRMRGRVGAIEWWIEKSEKAIKAIKPDPVASKKLDTIRNTLSKIDIILQEKIPEPPLLRPIQRELEQIPTLDTKESISAPAPETEAPEPELPKDEPVEKEPPRAAPAKTDTVAINTEQDAQKILSESIQKIRQASAFILEHNQADPTAYRYRRLASWAQVVELPPASDGRTQIQPPAPQVRQTLMDLKDKEQWSAFIISAEQRLSQFIFWFDLNRWVAEALLKLGDKYQAAHDAVCMETISFLYRFPDLPELSFSDGTPFSDIETGQWLKELGPDNTLAVKDKTVDKPEGNMDHFTDVQGKAQTMAKKKKWFEAVELFQVEMKKSSTQKETFLWRIAMCKMLIKFKHKDMIVPHLDLILNDINAYKLESWDPLLALEGLKLVWAGFSSQPDGTSNRNPDPILSRIAGLDPVEALKLGKS